MAVKYKKRQSTVGKNAYLAYDWQFCSHLQYNLQYNAIKILFL